MNVSEQQGAASSAKPGTAPAKQVPTGKGSRLLLGIVLALAVAAGIWGRFYQLGGRPLAEDEYYFVQSVRFILASGLPEFPSGGYYPRAVPIQYLTALSVKLFGNDEFSDRLPAAIFSLLTAGIAFVYARRHIGKAGAAAVSAALLVSSWEIEFARFARMYSAHQFFCVAFLASLPGCQSGSVFRRILPHLLLSMAILIQPVAVCFVPLLFGDLVLDWIRRRKLSWLAIAGTAATMAVFLGQHFLTGFTTEVGPENAAANLAMAPQEFLVIPAFPFWSVSTNAKLNLALIFLLFGAAGLASLLWKRPSEQRLQLFLSLAFLISASTHQLFAAGLFLLVLVARFKVYRFRAQPTWARALVMFGIMAAVGWILWAAAHTGQLRAAVPGDFAKAIRLTFVGWPDFYHAALAPWGRILPLITVAALAALFVQLFLSAGRSLEQILSNPALPLLCFLMFVGLVASPQSTTRYSFFLYPTVLLLIIYSGRCLLERFNVRPQMTTAVPILAFTGVFLFSGDFRPRHILKVASSEVSFRKGSYARYAEHWIHRFDYKTPADFLNRTAGADEPVIISARERPLTFYLTRPYAVSLPRWSANFPLIARQGGRMDRWSNTRMLTDAVDVREFTTNAPVVWYVRRVNPGRIPRRDFEFEDAWGKRLLSVERAYLGQDGHAEVLRIILSPEPPAENVSFPRMGTPSSIVAAGL